MMSSTIFIDDSLATLVSELARLERGGSTMATLMRHYERAAAGLAEVRRAFDARAPELSAHAHHAYLAAILLARTITCTVPVGSEMCERLRTTAQGLLRLLDRFATPADRALRVALVGELPSPMLHS